MFNLGFSEIIIIGILALIFIGPKQMPEMARVLGRMINEFKKATSDLSGGLLDIKNELREPFQEGLDAITKIQEDVTSKVKAEVEKTKKAVFEDDEPTLKTEIEKIESDESEKTQS